jgi:hypothetical protein
MDERKKTKAKENKRKKNNPSIPRDPRYWAYCPSPFAVHRVVSLEPAAAEKKFSKRRPSHEAIEISKRPSDNAVKSLGRTTFGEVTRD